MDEDKKSKVVKKVKVKVVSAKGKSALIEWKAKDLTKRGYVPLQELSGDTVPEDVLAAATPYGVPWEEYLKVEATPESIAERLRAAGIWTPEDLQLNQQRALGALLATYQVNLAALNRAAKSYKRGDK